MKQLFRRASFWKLVTQSGQMALGVAQGITLAADTQHVWNYLMAASQIGLGIVAIWTKDDDNNDVIDIVEPKPIVHVSAPESVEVKVDNTAGGGE